MHMNAIEPAYAQRPAYKKQIPTHVNAAKTRLIETAAEPKSFAKPDSGFSSTPILSTTTSIAVLIISTNMTKSTVAIKINCSVGEASITKVTGIAMSNARASCLNADSFFINHLMALPEFFTAR